MGFLRRTPNAGRLAASLPDGPLRDFASVPLPADQTPARELRLLAVDVETTGLDARTDRVLSIGYVPVDGERIVLSGAGHVVVRQDAEVGQSAAIHRITDDELAAGQSPQEALVELLTALRGRVLLAHHAAIERDFLRAMTRQAWGAALPLTTIDTMQLQYRLLTRGFDDEPAPGSLRLWRARQQYGLPDYRAHHALTDALACAELYLAQTSELGWEVPLKKLR